MNDWYARLSRQVFTFVCVVAFSGCGSADAESQTLSPADVMGLPSGTAMGSTFSGTYVIQTSELGDCDCRVGTCSMVHASRGAQLAFTHTDGALRILERTAQGTEAEHSGGIDRDGKFRAGLSLIVDALTWLSLMTGTVVPAVSVEARTRLTVIGSRSGADYDCDAGVEFHAVPAAGSP